MTIYLIGSFSSDAKAFTDRQLADSYLEQVNHNREFISHIKPIELVTDQFMEQILQSKESHETNTNSSL